MRYLQRRFPRVQFVKGPPIVDMNYKAAGIFQTPNALNHNLNDLEYLEFDFAKLCEEYRVKYDCDYICSGMSKYEGMRRAIMMRRDGLLQEKSKRIFPIGLMNYRQVIDMIKSLGLKLNPSYKFCSESHDTPTYFKQRSAFIGCEGYENEVMREYPMLALDKYRWEKLWTR